MTAQFSDPVTYRGEQYALTGNSGKGLFDPTAHGMKPVGRFSACWRGFICDYRIDRQALSLHTLRINLDGQASVLFGIKPEPDEEIHLDEIALRLFDVIYRRMNYKVPYTGGLLLARDFIEELYVHMGFHAAWKYREVHELIFDNGDLLEESDRSKEIADFREAMINRPLEPGFGASQSEIENWIKQCFTQEYRW